MERGAGIAQSGGRPEVTSGEMQNRSLSDTSTDEYLDRLWRPSPNGRFVRWLREEPGWADTKAAVDAWVRRYLPRCPDNLDKFIDDLRANWPGSSWQMYLWLLLQAHGYGLEDASGRGPDIALLESGRKLWVECIAPGPGSGELTAQPLPTERVIAGDPNGEKVILRITGALAAKAQQTKEHIDAGLISADECIVIAVSLASVSTSGTSRLESYCLRALYGVGQPIFRVPIGDPVEPIRVEQRFQSEIAKPSGAQVPLIPFVSDQYPWISGLLMNPFDVTSDPELGGGGLWYFPNLSAQNKLPEGFFRFGTEVRCGADGSLYSVNHRKPPEARGFGHAIIEILKELGCGG